MISYQDPAGYFQPLKADSFLSFLQVLLLKTVDSAAFVAAVFVVSIALICLLWRRM